MSAKTSPPDSEPWLQPWQFFLLGGMLARLVEVATATVRAAGLQSADVSTLYFTGGSSGMTALRDAFAQAYPDSRVVVGDLFGSVVAVLWFGAQGVLAGTITPGTLSQFLIYSVLAAGSLGALSEVWSEFSQASGAASRLIELLQEKPAIAAPDHPIALPVPALGKVEFDNVQFAYPTRPSMSALKGLNLTVRPGEKVAIVGASGAGKTTVFSLLLRYYDPDSGRVLVDGDDIRQADPEALRARIAIVPQDTTIFATSVHENIAFGAPNATRQTPGCRGASNASDSTNCR